MTKIKVSLDVPNEECLGCDFFDLDWEWGVTRCWVFKEDIHYNEEIDCYEPCLACKQARIEVQNNLEQSSIDKTDEVLKDNKV